MIIKRTANAGVLITLDNVSILIDGVCDNLHPYIETPTQIRNELETTFPDVVAFTHTHPDHFNADYCNAYIKKTRRSVIGPAMSISEQINDVCIKAINTRHIGKTDIDHSSIVIKGSKTIWFMGDASPSELVKLKSFTIPEVLIIPYAYALTPSAIKQTRAIGAKLNVLIHLPNKNDDSFGLWDGVLQNIGNDSSFIIPDVGQQIEI